MNKYNESAVSSIKWFIIMFIIRKTKALNFWKTIKNHQLMIFCQRADHIKKEIMAYLLHAATFLDLQQLIQIGQAVRLNQRGKNFVKSEAKSKNFNRFIERWLLEPWSTKESEKKKQWYFLCIISNYNNGLSTSIIVLIKKNQTNPTKMISLNVKDLA